MSHNYQPGVILIGTGSVATNIGKLFIQNGIHLTQILGRSSLSTKALAQQLKCPYVLSLQELSQKANLYIICVQDHEIEPLLDKIHIPKEALIVHTAGGVSIDIFKKSFNHYGVLYPLQSLRKETSGIPKIPFYVDGNNQQSKTALEQFCRHAGLNFQWADDTRRMKLHIAAVFCSNFTNYMYSLAERFCNDHQMDFSSLLPLIEQTAQRLQTGGASPSTLQTGPAVRGDVVTTEKHLALLQNDPEASKVYQYLTEKIKTSDLFKTDKN